MTIVNRLIAEARSHPAELVITDQDVSGLAEHCRQSLYPRPDPSFKGEIEKQMRAGEMRFMGIPLRVIGQRDLS